MNAAIIENNRHGVELLEQQRHAEAIVMFDRAVQSFSEYITEASTSITHQEEETNHQPTSTFSSLTWTNPLFLESQTDDYYIYSRALNIVTTSDNTGNINEEESAAAVLYNSAIATHLRLASIMSSSGSLEESRRNFIQSYQTKVLHFYRFASYLMHQGETFFRAAALHNSALIYVNQQRYQEAFLSFEEMDRLLISTTSSTDITTLMLGPVLDDEISQMLMNSRFFLTESTVASAA